MHTLPLQALPFSPTSKPTIPFYDISLLHELCEIPSQNCIKHLTGVFVNINVQKV